MIKLISILQTLREQTSRFTNWVTPSDADLRREFKVEHELKGHSFFESEQDFIQKIKSAKRVKITPQMDSNIAYRSRTRSFDELLNLIKGYRSYPKYRNEKTLRSIYHAFEQNEKMDMPIVLKFPDGDMRIFSGNTRMDIAFQLGIHPIVLLVSV